MSTTIYQTINVTPRGKGDVASVTCVDFHNLPDSQLREIYLALTRHQVLEFPGSCLTQEQQLALTRRLCEASSVSAHNLRITEITNQGEYSDYELDWHTDSYFKETGPKIGILNAITIPSTAVNTRFCNMIKLWGDVREDLQRELRGKSICNDAVYTQYGRPRGPIKPTTEDFRKWPHVEHPIVHIDPDSRKEALHLGARKWAFIKDVDQRRSDEILEELWKMVDSGEYTFEAEWQEDMLVMWRNDLVLHFKPKGNGEPRLLDRTSVPGQALVMASLSS
ncbi:hypothetical protein F4777DRAFT_31288 [Nemania sp. FL0916]|nr:hypothetical protein F4777DRAFT_31288 [Nemania sp. FL0916]